MTLGITAHIYWEVNAQTAHGQAKLLSTINKLPNTSAVYQTKKIYLEDGDTTSGLDHIMESHGGDFERKFDVTGKQAVADYIHSIVLQGDSCTFGFQANSRSGLNVCYETVDSKGKKSYIQMVISDSGYIVTAYPRRKARQSDWDYRKKKEKQE